MSIDSCQNGTCADHNQKNNSVGSGPLRYTIWHFPLQAGRICLTHTRSLLIRIFATLMKVNWQLSNKSVRWPSSPDYIAGSFFYPLRSRIFFKFSAHILFDHGLNSKPHSLENLFILENLPITGPDTDHSTFRPFAPQAHQCLISYFLASLGACNLILYIHVLINWQPSK